MIRSYNNRGDTIIEVVLAMALLTSILFTSWSITNRATQISEAARERTLMVDQVKQQAELIKSQWSQDQAFSNSIPATSGLDPNPCKKSSGSPVGGQAWYLYVDSGNRITPSSPGSVLSVSGDSTKQVWVQKVAGTNYTDFWVRACWINNSGQTQKEESSQLLLRLNT